MKGELWVRKKGNNLILTFSSSTHPLGWMNLGNYVKKSNEMKWYFGSTLFR